MAIPAAPVVAGITAEGLVAAQSSANKASGVVKDVLNTLKEPIISFHWEAPRDKYGNIKIGQKMLLGNVDLNITGGLILGMIALGLGWEALNWFAQSFKQSSSAVVPGLDLLLFATSGNPMFLISMVYGPDGKPLKDAQGNPKTVTKPVSFGQAYNILLRDLTLGGPGVLAGQLASMAKALAPTGP